MQGKTNTGVGGGLEGTASLTVNAPVNVTVSVTKDDKTFTRSSGASGVVKFGGLSTGTWKVKIDDGRGQTREKDVMIVADYNVTIAFFEVSVTVNYPAGSTVIAQNDGETLNAPDTSGLWEAKLNKPGNWTFTATKGKDTDTKTINITEESRDIVVKLSFEAIPVFTYTGNYEIVDDGDSLITNLDKWRDNWKIRFLTSGELQFTQLNGAENGIDVFLVGGGGGSGPGAAEGAGYGGGGGYYSTNIFMPKENTVYPIVIGAGGAGGVRFSKDTADPGTSTTAFSLTAEGGKGGGNGYNGKQGAGGSATGEFNTSGNTYSGTLGRGRPAAGAANSGKGAGGGVQSVSDPPGKVGGSGIVIIRNHRA